MKALKNTLVNIEANKREYQQEQFNRCINKINLWSKKTKCVVGIDSLNKGIVIERGFFNVIITSVKLVINRLKGGLK